MIINLFFCRTTKVFDCFYRRAIFSSFLTRLQVLYILFIPVLVLLLLLLLTCLHDLVPLLAVAVVN